MDPKTNLVVAVTGASGALYGRSFLRALWQYVPGVSRLIVSPAAIRVYNAEFGTELESEKSYLDEVLSGLNDPVHSFSIDDYKDIGARPASGSVFYHAMVVVPCSMKTLAGIAQGYSNTLVERAADVCLKERRKLIVVPRETPYSLVHLQNMTQLTQAGAIVLPASPGFYQIPRTLEDLADFISGRIFGLLGLHHELYKKYDPD